MHNCLSGCYLLLFIFLKILFIYFREGMGGRKSRRETSICGCLSRAPHGGPGPQPRHLPFGLQAVVQSTKPLQPGLSIAFWLRFNSLCFQRIWPFQLSCDFTAIKLFIVSPYHVSRSRINSDVTFPMSNIGNLTFWNWYG